MSGSISSSNSGDGVERKNTIMREKERLEYIPEEVEGDTGFYDIKQGRESTGETTVPEEINDYKSVHTEKILENFPEDLNASSKIGESHSFKGDNAIVEEAEHRKPVVSEKEHLTNIPEEDETESAYEDTVNQEERYKTDSNVMANPEYEEREIGKKIAEKENLKLDPEAENLEEVSQ